MLLKKSAENEVQLEFNEQIYPKEKILEAVRDFRDVCKVTLRDNIVILKSRDKKENIENLAYDFSNYLLGLIVAGGI